MANLNGIINGLGANPELDLSGISDEQLLNLSEEVETQFAGYAGLGKIRRNIKNETKRRLAAKPQASPAVLEKGKELYKNRIKEIADKDIVRDIQDGNLAVSDFAVYSQKIGLSRTEMFQPKDKEETGVTNVNNGKMKNNGAFLVTSIVLLSGVNADPAGDPEGKNIQFGRINKAIANGNFTFKNGQKTFMEDSSVSCFDHDGNAELMLGEYKLDIPKMIDPKNDIVFDIDAAGTIPANTHIKVVLKGTVTVKA